MSDEAGPFRGRRVDKPWGYEIVWAETTDYMGKILHIERGEQLSYQYHGTKDETIFVSTGELELEFAPPPPAGDGRPEEPRRRIRLTAGQSFRLRPGWRHRMTAIETCDVLEASTAHPDDIVRLEDRYGRTTG